MKPKQTNDMGGWRSVVAVCSILSFLIFVGLLAFTGHLQHMSVSLVYLLVVAFVLVRLFPKTEAGDVPFDPDSGFRFSAIGEERSGGCCGTSAAHNPEVKQ